MGIDVFKTASESLSTLKQPFKTTKSEGMINKAFRKQLSTPIQDKCNKITK